jgi:hypothetical protein
MINTPICRLLSEPRGHDDKCVLHHGQILICHPLRQVLLGQAGYCGEGHDVTCIGMAANVECLCCCEDNVMLARSVRKALGL